MRFIALVIMLLVAPSLAQATVLGTYPTFERSFEVFGDREVTGNTLMVYNQNVNKALMEDGSVGTVVDVPQGATVEAAYLFWTGTYDQTPDRTVDFTLPNGSVINDLHVNQAQPGEDPAVVQGQDCLTRQRNFRQGFVNFNWDFFYCRRDITHTLRGLGANINGDYRVADVDALPGWPQDGRSYGTNDQRCADSNQIEQRLRFGCQAMYAGWSMVVVWSHPDQRIRRNITVNDGFLLMDDDNASPGITSVTMENFQVPEGASGEFSFFGLEGDPDYGSIQALLPPGQGRCTNCPDFVAMRTSGNANETQLFAEPGNSEGNLWNGSIMTVGGGVSPGVDIDVYDVGTGGLNILREGDRSATFRMGTGDGVRGAQGDGNGGQIGNGELVLLGWTALSLDVVSPNLNSAATRKSVSRTSAGPGDVIQYQLSVTNDGSAPASNVVVVDVIPTGTTYETGSTVTTCDADPADVDGTSPLVAGFNIGALPHQPVSRANCTITFRVRVNDDAEPGSVIRNTAQITSTEQEEFSTNQVQTQIVGPSLGTPLLTASDLNGGVFELGDSISYQLEVPNIGDSGAAGMTLTATWPIQLNDPVVLAGEFLSNYDPGTRTLTISNVSVAANTTARINIVTSIAGAEPALVSNQFALSASFLEVPLLSDDPNVPGPFDPTVFGVVDGPNLTSSSKFGEDVNGAPLVPGDQVRYTVSLRNSGNREANFSVEDVLQAPLTGCTVQSFDAVLMNAECNGQTLTVSGRLPAGEARSVVILSTVANVPDGTVVTNEATLTVQGEGATALTSPNLVVAQGGILVTSSLEFTDVDDAPLAPGDLVDVRFIARNTGGAAVRDLAISTVLDPRLGVEEISDNGAAQGASITWDNLGELAAGASRTVTLRVRIQSGLATGTSIAVTGQFAGLALDPFDAEPINLVIDALPELGLTKAVAAADDGQYNPGDLVRYTLTLTNNSQVLAENLVLRDPFPDGLVQVAANSGGTITDGEALWNAQTTPALASLTTGASVELELTARIANPMEDRRELINQARLSADDAQAVQSDDPNTPLADDPTSITVRSETTLVVEKTDESVGDANYEPGSQVRYRIRVGAGGTQRARGLVVVDQLPDGVTLVSSEPAAQVNGSTLTWSAAQAPGLGNLTPGNEEQLTILVRIDDRALSGASIANQVRVAGETHNGDILSNDPDTPEVDDPTTFLVGGNPDIIVIKTAEEQVADDVWRIGERVAYNILVRNQGSVDAVNLSIVDVIDPNLDQIQVEGGWGTFADGRITGSLDRLNNGTDTTLRFTAVLGAAPDGTVVVNQASVQVAGGGNPILSDDPELPGNADPTSLILSAEEGVSLLKTVEDVNGGAVLPGDRLRYTITMTNTGQNGTGALAITDVLDERLELLGVEPGLTNSVSGSTITWTQGGLEPGQSVEAAFIVQVAQGLVEGTAIPNQASTEFAGEAVLSDDGEVGENDPSPTLVTIGVIPVPVLSVTKTVEPASAQRGDVVEWTITVRNDGEGALEGGLITDALDESLELIEVTGAAAQGNQITASLNIDPNESAEVVVRTRVAQSAGESISNQAELTSGDEVLRSDDPNTDEDGDATVLAIEAAPLDPVLEKSVVDLNGEPLEPGDEVEYQMVLINRGTEALPAVTVTDTLDSGLTYVQDSLIFEGTPVAGDFPLQAGATLPEGLAPGERASVSFRALVVDDAEQGQVITNQATLSDPDGNTWLSDDPNLPGSPQPTLLQVGSSGAVAAFKRVTPAEIDRGDEVTWTIELLSSANGTRTVRLTDLLPAGLSYVENTVTLDGLPLTDAVDADEVTVDPGVGRLEMTIDLGPDRPRAVLEFRSQADVSNQSVLNQAVLDVNGETGLTDGDPQTPGFQGTALVIRPDGAGLEGEKVATDSNGGTVQPGDEIAYEIRLRNGGDQDLVIPAGALEDPLSQMTYKEDSAEPAVLTLGGDTLRNTEPLTVPAGGNLTLRFVTVLNPDLQVGQPVVNTVFVREPVEFSAEARLEVGTEPPGATLTGTVFVNGASDRKLQNWLVRVANSRDRAQTLETQTDADGRYTFAGLSWETVEIEVLNTQNTRFYTKQITELVDGAQVTHDCAIDPSGVIYDQVSGAPIAGAAVQILYDASGDPVLSEDLPEGQQGQVTGADGFYRFDVNPPHIYRLAVTPPGAFHSFPSQELRPVGATLSRRFGRPSRMSQNPDRSDFFEPVDGDGNPMEGRAVVEAPVPDAAARMPYFLRFDIQSGEDAVFHNHVPLDPLRKQVKLTRRASKSQASAGDLVTFTVEVENRSSQVLDANLDGGIDLLDMLPPGLLVLRDGDNRVKEAFERFDSEGRRAVVTDLRSEGDGFLRSLRGVTLQPGARLLWHYRVQVSGSMASGELLSSNHLITRIGRMPVSEPVEHRLILTEDPILREATLIGRIYCDNNADGHPAANEFGVPGVRIYADHGVRVDSDAFGRFHFSRLSPGLRRFKIDVRTLPPGIKLVGTPGRNRLITPGVPLTLDYAVSCPKDLARAEEISANPLAEGAEAPPPPDPPPMIKVAADLVGQKILADGAALNGPVVEATATAVDGDPSFDLPQGPNLDPLASLVELHARVAGSLPLASWQWRIVNADGISVFTKKGQGAAPELLRWNVGENVPRNARYEAVLSVTDAGGDSATSRVIPVGLGLGMAVVDKRRKQARINEVNGVLFVDAGSTPAPRLRGWFNDRIARLRGEADLMAQVFVYGAPKKGSKDSAMAYTQRRARTLEGMLLAAGLPRNRFRVQSMGNVRKLAPENDARLSRLNRRVELRFRPVAKQHPPLEPEAQPVAHLLVNGQPAEISKEGTAEIRAKVPVGHFLRVDVVFASGARTVLRRLRHPDGLSARAVVRRGTGIPVSGALRGDRALSVAGQSINLDALSVRLRPMHVAVPLNDSGSGLAEGAKAACIGMCFGTSSDMAMQGWELRVFSIEDGELKPGAKSQGPRDPIKIHEIKGIGPVPPVVNWDGNNAQGAFILREGVYSARLIARGKGGLVGLSRPVYFRAYRPQQDFRIVLADPFGDLKGKKGLPNFSLKGNAQRDFDRFVKLANRVGGSIELTGHVDVRLRASQAQAMSGRMAESVRDALAARGIDTGRVAVRGEGSSSRLVERARKASDHAKNRRVEMVLRSDELPSLPALRNRSARVHSPAGDLLAQRDGTVTGELFPDASGKITIQVEDGSGRSAQMPLQLSVERKIPDMEMVLVVPAVTADGAPLPETDATRLRVQLPANGAVLSSSHLGVFGASAPGLKIRVNGKLVDVHPLSGRFGTALNLKDGEHKILVEAEDAEGHRARITRTIKVKQSGRFMMAIADLGYQTVAARLPGLRDDRSVDLGGYGRIGGRAMVWYKERWNLGSSSFFEQLELNAYMDTDRRWGEFDDFSRDDLSLRLLPPEFGDEAKEVQEIKAAGPIFLDLKADDSRFRLANFKTGLPNRELLKYNRAFYGLDLMLDKTFGDAKKPERVIAQVYASDTGAGLRTATNLLRATGSSFYRLRHRDVLPGSERVRLVVRDAANGLVLYERSFARSTDYRIDATEGLLMLNQPLSSTAGTQMASAYGVSTADLGGHPVFLHVTYTHRDSQRLASFATGGRVDGSSKKLGLKGGVSYAYEGRADGADAFQAAGAFAGWKHKDGHMAKGEFAWSRAVDGDHFASADGGNSFSRMGEDPAQQPIDFNGRLYPTSFNPTGSPRTGIAWSLSGKVVAGKWLKRKKKDDATLDAYVRQTAPGFYGGGASLDQGQTRWGLSGGYKVDHRDRASLRYDASYSLVSAPLTLDGGALPEPALREYRRIHRESLTARYERRHKRWMGGLEYQLGYTGDSLNYVDAAEGTRGDVISNVISVDGLYRLDKRWSVGGAQRAILSGDDLRFSDPFARLLTAARARYAIDKKLSIELEEELRWNGDNQTRLSLVRRPNKNLEQYVQERLTTQSGGFYNTTVLGAMERKKKNSETARAEVHMDHALGQERMSGVVGLGRRYKLLPGLTLAMNYERFQVLSGGPALASPTPVTGQASERGGAGRVVGTSDLVGQPTTPRTGSPLLQSGMNGWGLAPVSGSRDAVALSVQYKKKRKLMITARSELRLELANDAKLEDATQQDRVIQFHEINARLRLNPDLAILGRYALAEVKNLTAAKREHLANEFSVGLALRPMHTDRYRGLLRYSRRQDLRADNRWLTKDLLAFEPIFRTPWYLQVATKLALKADSEIDPLLGDGTALTALFVPRVDFELSRMLRRQSSFPMPGEIELWAEYRLMADLTVGAATNGLALGMSYLPIKHLRVGMGYSFTAVPDQLTTSETVDGSGFFIRISGLY